MDRIKESFDSLPIAACFFDENDVVRLVNRRMLAIANWLRKGGIQTLEEIDRKSTRLNSSHITRSRMPSSA